MNRRDEYDERRWNQRAREYEIWFGYSLLTTRSSLLSLRYFPSYFPCTGALLAARRRLTTSSTLMPSASAR
jgi:hypothetical protein